jgi:hypothetical protein
MLEGVKNESNFTTLDPLEICGSHNRFFPDPFLEGQNPTHPRCERFFPTEILVQAADASSASTESLRDLPVLRIVQFLL